MKEGRCEYVACIMLYNTGIFWRFFMDDTAHQNNSNLADSIAMLEQILEVMPQDFDALKTLYEAYCKCGNQDRGFEYLRRLVDVVAMGGEAGGMAYTLQQLQKFETARPVEVEEMIACLQPLAGMPGNVVVPASAKQASVNQMADVDVGEELALAWRLYEDGQLSQEEYSSVLHDLTEVSSKDLDVPVSLLHVLNDRGFAQMNRIINYMSSRSGVPCISLQQFELEAEAVKALPLHMAAHEGILPFARFGDDLLVGVLNPFNGELREKAEITCGQTCHTYLVAPEDYDMMLGKLRSLAA